ncbi:CAF17-like 4Fe-4S cluster assembly/insertion protein YgfZ [Brachybacterium hainanense]|uniref:YgfZ/GcvT domain-containing protein n=1 Tax=Brachybacterium hainanense TaxID=1541174 RepID=A0ABV6RAB9_9MICO
MPEPSSAPALSRPLLSHGAILGTGADAAVPAHYGELLREQRRLLLGRAVVDLGQLEILEVSGADALSWLTTITSQVLTGHEVGTSLSLAVLTPQGRVEHLAAAALHAPDSVLLITDPGRRAGLRRYLEMMRFAARVEIADRDDLRALGGVRPAAEIPALAERGLPAPVAVWTDPWPQVAAGHVAYGPDPEDLAGWVLTILPAAPLAAMAWTTELLAGMHAAEALRIADHRPRLITEVDERSIPHELDLLRTAVHTDKGCYRGQETVAKVLNLGQPPRRLVMLHLDGSQDVPAHAGGPVHLGGPDGRQVGTVTTAAIHTDLGPIALAVVRRAVPVDAVLSVGVVLEDDREGTPRPEDAPAPQLWLDATQEPIVLERIHAARPRTARL